jgi:hypothetical protein
MGRRECSDDDLFTSQELAIHVVDTLVDHGFIERARFEEAAASAKWEFDAQCGIGRIVLKECSNVKESQHDA